MSGYTRREVAQRAGVDPGCLDRLVELGILTPDAGGAFSPGDARRARWLRGLEGAGVPLEGLAAAIRGGALSFSFLDAAAYDRFAGRSGATLGQLSAQTGSRWGCCWWSARPSASPSQGRRTPSTTTSWRSCR